MSIIDSNASIPASHRVQKIASFLVHPTTQKVTAVVGAIIALVAVSLYAAGTCGGGIVFPLAIAAPMLIIGSLTTAGIVWRIHRANKQREGQVNKEEAGDPQNKSQSRQLPDNRQEGVVSGKSVSTNAPVNTTENPVETPVIFDRDKIIRVYEMTPSENAELAKCWRVIDRGDLSAFSAVACVALLALDRGRTLDYNKKFESRGYQNGEFPLRLLREAGFRETAKTMLISKGERVKALRDCLKTSGSGILEAEGYGIVLHAICEETETATIRDPFHAQCMEIKLSALEDDRFKSFVQITGKSSR